MDQVSIVIEGQKILAERGKTILEVCQEHGIHIPTLCYHPRLRIVGACRVCVVEVEGARTLMTACTTPVDRDGMVVRTNTERVLEARKMIVELLLASGDHNCLTCDANGNCELQDLVYELRIEMPRFPVDPPNWDRETSNPMIVRDLNKCILCGRCVRACQEVQVHNVIDFGYRGARAKIVTAYDKDYAESNCVFCGECVQVCPTGALTENKARGLGRSWELEKVRTTCPYCGVGCQMWLHVKDGRIVKVTGVEDGAPNQGRLCVKGRFGYDFIYSPDRLTTPLIKENGGFRAASWDEALDVVVTRFKQIIATHGPDAIAGVSTARGLNEDSYQMQKLFRAVIGTNNIDHCART
jgi:predicted molibdopterin-dependent oxidoreductase YjgC